MFPLPRSTFHIPHSSSNVMRQEQWRPRRARNNHPQESLSSSHHLHQTPTLLPRALNTLRPLLSILAGAVFALLLKPSILALMPSMIGCHPMTPKLVVPPAPSSFVSKLYVPSRPWRCAWSERLLSRTRVRVRLRERLRERCCRYLLLLPPNISSRCLLMRDEEEIGIVGSRFSAC